MATIQLSSVKSAEQYQAIVNNQLKEYKAGLHVERNDGDVVVIRVGKMAERISDDALVVMASVGREISDHDVVVAARKVVRQRNSKGLQFAKVTLA